MSNIVVPQGFSAVSNRFTGVKNNDLSAGIEASFALIGYRGKVWSIRYRGEERPLMRDDGDGPRNSIEVVIVKAAGVKSKIYYPDWKPGSNEPPHCFSTNGLAPDPGAKHKQHASCAACPMNAWGSRISEAGKPGKACADSKRLAVVPMIDIPNELFGGPMLLRVPAASLNELAEFGDGMSKLGFPYFSFATRISFDPQAEYPKFKFSAIRPLTDSEADIVMEMQNSPRTTRILAEGAEHAAVQSAAPASPFEQPVPQQVTPQAPVTPRPTVVSAPVAATAPAPAVTPTNGGFGAMGPAVPVTENKPRPTLQVVPAESVAPSQEAPSSFDDDLEAQLANLLPPT